MGLLAALSLLAGAVAGPQTNEHAQTVVPAGISIKTNFYIFRGTNHAQMRAAMLAARPWKQTLPFDAQTKWEVQSNYRVHREAGQFSLEAVEVSINVLITLPWWIPGQRVDRDLAARWQRCANGLATHELGHVQLALAAGAAVKERLLALGLSPSSQELAALASRTINDTIHEFREREVRYDQTTRHGVTQGAVFPMTQLEARD